MSSIKPPQAPSGTVHTPSTIIKIGDCTFKDYNLITWYRRSNWKFVEVCYDGVTISIGFSLPEDTEEACEKLDAILYGDYGKTEITQSLDNWTNTSPEYTSFDTAFEQILPKPVNPDLLALEGLAFWCQAHNATIHLNDDKDEIVVWQGLKQVARFEELITDSIKQMIKRIEKDA